MTTITVRKTASGDNCKDGAKPTGNEKAAQAHHTEITKIEKADRSRKMNQARYARR